MVVVYLFSRIEPAAQAVSSWLSRAAREGTFQDLSCVIHRDAFLLPSKHGGFCTPPGMALSNALELQYKVLEKAIPLGFILHCYTGAIQPRSLE